MKLDFDRPVPARRRHAGPQPARMPNALWLDDLYMSVPALAQMGALTGERKYFDDAVKQVLQFSERMFVPENGPLSCTAGCRTWTRTRRSHWGRANGWAIVAMAELLERAARGSSRTRRRARAIPRARCAASPPRRAAPACGTSCSTGPTPIWRRRPRRCSPTPSPSDTITGEGLKEAMAGAQVVIDLANSPSFEDKAVLEFFETSGRNLLAAEAAAGVRHHVALSIVGTDRTPDNGYFRAKVAQEKLIEASGIPYTIIRSTQFLEFLGGIAASSADGNMVRISPGLFQPIAADDVAAIVADVALAAPRNGIVEIAGPERAPFNEIVARYLKAVGDPREVVSDPEARYWGGRVEERSLVPLGEARLGRIGLDEWLRRSQARA